MRLLVAGQVPPLPAVVSTAQLAPQLLAHTGKCCASLQLATRECHNDLRDGTMI